MPRLHGAYALAVMSGREPGRLLGARLGSPLVAGVTFALIDKTFFSKKAHPARKLLDSLGEVGMQLPADFSPTSTLYKPLETVTQKLIDGFQESMEIFDELRAELDQVIGEENRRAEAEARRVAQAIEQKERLEVAKAVGSDRKGKISLALYVAAIAASAFLPALSYGIYVLVALIWLVPDRRIEERLHPTP